MVCVCQVDWLGSKQAPGQVSELMELHCSAGRTGRIAKMQQERDTAVMAKNAPLIKVDPDTFLCSYVPHDVPLLQQVIHSGSKT